VEKLPEYAVYSARIVLVEFCVLATKAYMSGIFVRFKACSRFVQGLFFTGAVQKERSNGWLS
jgi:hypothetical protein